MTDTGIAGNTPVEDQLDGKKPMVDAGRGGMKGTIMNLWPYMWPSDRPDLKRRVFYASIFMVIGKIVTVLIPYFYKLGTDALTGDLQKSDSISDWMPLFLLTPIMLVIAYNIGPVVSLGFNQLRDALLASVVNMQYVSSLPSCLHIYMH